MMELRVLLLLMFCVLFGAIDGSRGRQCRIPNSPAKFRKGWRQMRAGAVMRTGERVTVACKKDIYGDAIHSWSHHICRLGRWIPAFPSCKAQARCDAPSELNHVIALERINPSQTFPHGHRLRYKCKEGYKMEGSLDFILCRNGQWTPTRMSCDKNGIRRPVKNHLFKRPLRQKAVEIVQSDQDAECKLKVDNGRLTPIHNETGTVYKLICDTFYLPQQEKYECHGGAWLSTSPTCESKTCRKLKGDYTLVDGEGLTQGAEVIVHCDQSTSYPHFGIVRAWCYDGEWLPGRPECKQYCELPPGLRNVTDARTDRPIPRLVMHAVRVGQICGDGSSQDNQCRNGKWTRDFLQCN